jgi:hypothetical protein
VCFNVSHTSLLTFFSFQLLWCYDTLTS